MKPLLVGLDGRIIGGTGGGVEGVVQGLVSALAALSDGDDEYLVLSYRGGADDWLRPFLSGRVRAAYVRQSLPILLKRIASRWAPILRRNLLWKMARPLGWAPFQQIPTSDGTIERAGVEVMHLVRQDAFRTRVPTIYHPHDLQHRHLPQFFSPFEREARDRAYQTYCAEAAMVGVTASWGKRDLMEQYGVPAEKIWVVPWAPPLPEREPAEADLAEVRARFSLPEAFVFYPAQTWPHKNHLGLLEALGVLRRDHGRVIPLICSGRLTEHYRLLIRKARHLGIHGEVKFLGFVDSVALRVLYRLARCVVIPTKFEAASSPLWEAFAAGTPAACSRVTSLPEQAGDAAILFDADVPAEIAQAILRLWDEQDLRHQLVQRGRKRVAEFTWDRTARLFRAHYRRLSARPLTAEDQGLLAEPARL